MCPVVPLFSAGRFSCVAKTLSSRHRVSHESILTVPSYQKYSGQPDIAPYPYLWVRIVDNAKGLEFGPFGAIVDSAADYTCIPSQVLAGITGYDTEIDVGRDFGGNPVRVDLVYILDATIELLEEDGTVLMRKKVERLRLPIVDNNGLLGRDILNHGICMLDGPGQVCTFH